MNEKIIDEPNKQEFETSPEEILTPEVIGKIMEKVQDINKEGTAFTAFTDLPRNRLNEKLRDNAKEQLVDILSHGLFGQTSGVTDYRSSDWLMRRGKIGALFFNIAGRMKDSKKIAKAGWIGRFDSMGLIFDISHFTEIYPQSTMEMPIHSRFKKYYAAQHDEGARQYIAKRNPKMQTLDDVKVESGYGFMINGRVSPRFFRGILLSFEREETDPSKIKEKYEKLLKQEEDKGMFGAEYEVKEWREHKDAIVSRLKEEAIQTRKREDRIGVLAKKAEEIAAIMKQTYVGKEKYLLPIYDVTGKLLWPQQMSYEEVKKFIAERDSKKERK